ncbi:unnamed protein product, partial [Nesidiocoris tenuis]
MTVSLSLSRKKRRKKVAIGIINNSPSYPVSRIWWLNRVPRFQRSKMRWPLGKPKKRNPSSTGKSKKRKRKRTCTKSQKRTLIGRRNR